MVVLWVAFVANPFPPKKTKPNQKSMMQKQPRDVAMCRRNVSIRINLESRGQNVTYNLKKLL